MWVAKQPNAEAIDLQFKFMKEQFDDHRNDTNKRFDRLETLIKDWFSSLPNTYATKEEHEANKVAINELKATHTKIAWSAISFIWATIVGFAWFVLKKLWIF